MARLNEYIIPFYAFSNGEHEFNFVIQDSFFKHFEYSEIEHADLKVDVLLSKSDRQLTFKIHLKGWAKVICDRCLDEFRYQVDNQYTLYGKFGDGNNEEEYDVIWISRANHDVDLSGFFYEFLVLSLPMKRVHSTGPDGTDGCNPEMLKKLDELSID